MRLADLELLGVSRNPTTAEVKDAFTSMAALYHPDTGGAEASAEKLQALVEARDRLLEELSKPKRCPDCDGAGKVTEMVGFVAAKVRCETCKGTGKVAGA